VFFLLTFVFLVYWPGLGGGFLLDDYPQFVTNDAMGLPQGWTVADILAALTSSDAGPFGRPVALVTFVVQRAIVGLDPWSYKLFNVVIHAANIVLVYLFIYRICQFVAFGARKYSESECRDIALLSAAIWGVHPYCLTSVLYVIQRMTSLSVTFSLVAMISYITLRQHGWRSSRGLAFGALAICAFALALLTKETALLVPVYCFVLEVVFLRFKSRDGRRSLPLQVLYLFPMMILLAAIGLRLMTDPGLLERMYAGRPFGVEERLSTQVIILWSYLRNIFIPDIRSMGLHLDDFPLRSGGLSDPFVLIGALGHILFVGLALYFRRKQQFFAFGVLFFYAGHLLESTAWPLELAYEHRNYLPMIGFCVMLGAALHSVIRRIGSRKGAVLFGFVMLGLGGATAVRSAQWGDPVTFALVEAEKHPDSGRANFDAGRELIVLILRMGSSEPELGRRAIWYLEQSMGKGMVSVEPFLVGLQAQAQLGVSLPSDFQQRFLIHLENGYLPNGLYGLAQGLLSLSRFQPRTLTNDQLDSFYLAALKNSRVVGTGRGHLLTSYSIFLAEQRGDLRRAAEVSEKAVLADNKFIPFLQNAAWMAFAVQNEVRAIELIGEVQSLDHFGLHRRETERIRSYVFKGSEN
jgi:hypothetical protein